MFVKHQKRDVNNTRKIKNVDPTKKCSTRFDLVTSPNKIAYITSISFNNQVYNLVQRINPNLSLIPAKKKKNHALFEQG